MKDHKSVRILLINKKKQLLLMKAHDPQTTGTDGKYNGDFWFLVGGEEEPGENLLQNIKRELFEETGLKEEDYEIGPLVWTGDFKLILSGTPRRMKQKFIVVKTNKNDISTANFTENEKKVVKELKWFSLEEIKSSKEIIYPVNLKDKIENILEEIYPDIPFDIDAGKNPLFK